MTEFEQLIQEEHIRWAFRLRVPKYGRWKAVCYCADLFGLPTWEIERIAKGE